MVFEQIKLGVLGYFYAFCDIYKVNKDVIRTPMTAFEVKCKVSFFGKDKLSALWILVNVANIVI